VDKKMISIGITPSSTGKKGGKITGQKISEYESRDGLFQHAAIALVEIGFCIGNPPIYNRGQK